MKRWRRNSRLKSHMMELVLFGFYITLGVFFAGVGAYILAAIEFGFALLVWYSIRW